MPQLREDEAPAALRRAAFRDFLTEEGLTPADLARLMGRTTANAFYNFLNGRTGSLSASTLARMKEVLPHADIGRLIAPEDRVTQPSRAPASVSDPSSLLLSLGNECGMDGIAADGSGGSASRLLALEHENDLLKKLLGEARLREYQLKSRLDDLVAAVHRSEGSERGTAAGN